MNEKEKRTLKAFQTLEWHDLAKQNLDPETFKEIQAAWLKGINVMRLQVMDRGVLRPTLILEYRRS